MKGKKLMPRLLFEQVEPIVKEDPRAYLIFDNTVLEKRNEPSIKVARKQWSGNKKDLIRSTGVVSLVYATP